MFTLPTDLLALAALTAARHPLPLTAAADVAAVTALIVDSNPSAGSVHVLQRPDAPMPAAA
ncbi:MAG: hypothetical protein ACTHQ3_19005 [Motilibacteraceae bacterium]